MTVVQGLLLPALESDGRQTVVTTPATNGWKTWFTGAGDQITPSVVKGGGQKLRFSFDGYGTETIEFQFSDPVEMHDGRIFYTPVANWDMDDYIDFNVSMAATVSTYNGGQTGNANKVPSGLGYDILVPAAGDGYYDVTLADAVPVPVSDRFNPNGYWDVDENTGDITASADVGTAMWHLLDVPVTARFINKMPMGNPLGVIDFDVYKAEWLHPNWKLKATVTKNSDSAGEVAAWMLTFRRDNTV